MLKFVSPFVLYLLLGFSNVFGADRDSFEMVRSDLQVRQLSGRGILRDGRAQGQYRVKSFWIRKKEDFLRLDFFRPRTRGLFDSRTRVFSFWAPGGAVEERPATRVFEGSVLAVEDLFDFGFRGRRSVGVSELPCPESIRSQKRRTCRRFETIGRKSERRVFWVRASRLIQVDHLDSKRKIDKRVEYKGYRKVGRGRWIATNVVGTELQNGTIGRRSLLFMPTFVTDRPLSDELFKRENLGR